jgi:hypothetical protein
MVDTQSVARAQVLIYPYPHDVADVTAQTSPPPPARAAM